MAFGTTTKWLPHNSNLPIYPHTHTICEHVRLNLFLIKILFILTGMLVYFAPLNFYTAACRDF